MKKGLFFFMCVSLVVPGVCKSGSNCWVADYGNCKVVKLGATGIRLCELDSIGLRLQPVSLDVDPQTGWCWEASFYENRVHRISPACDIVKEHTFGEVNPSTPCVDGNGYCWYVFMWTGKLIKVDENWNIVHTINDFIGATVLTIAAAIDLNHQTLWVAETGLTEGYVSKFSCSGTTYQFRLSGFNARGLDVDQTTHCCWVADHDNNRVAKISSDGSDIKYFTGFNAPSCVSVDPVTHCCWVADTKNNRVVKLSETGDTLCVATDFNHPCAVAADPLDHGCWVSDRDNNRVVKLDADCGTSFTVPDFLSPAGLAIDTIAVGIEESERITPKDFALLQNYPNPFTQKTVIEFRVQSIGVYRDTPLQLQIYDLSGRLVKSFTITDCRFPINKITWDGKTDNGNLVSSGVYFCVLTSKLKTHRIQIVLLR